MEITEILSKLERLDGPFPLEAVEEARARREEITPYLLEVLRDTRERLDEVAWDADWMAPMYALYLLGEFREKKAYPLVVELFEGPEEAVDELAGEFLAQDLDRVLISVYDGDDGPIRRLIENPAVNEWARGAGVRAMTGLVARGLKERGEVVAYFRQILMGPPEHPCSNFWNELVSCAADLHPADCLEEIRRAYEENLVDESFVTLEEVEGEAEGDFSAAMDKVRADSQHGFIDNTAEEMKGWACFQEGWEKEGGSGEWGDDEDDWDGGYRVDPSEAESPGGTVRREGPKVGRNDPCPCGSGKKYKKCCGG